MVFYSNLGCEVFQGSHAITMDAKGRMAIPSKFREGLMRECGGRIVVTAHTQDRCLLVYSEPQWQEILPKIEALPTFNKSALRAQRLLIGYATALELDGNGRVLLPPTLRDYGHFDKKLMLVGLGKKFELWSEQSWFESIGECDEQQPLPEEMLSLSL